VLYDADPDCLTQIQECNKNRKSELHVLPYCFADACESTVFNVNYDPYTSSLLFVDWRWYKSITADHQDCQIAIEQCWQNAHNFLDHSRVLPPRPEAANRQLCDLCRAVRDMIRDLENTQNLQLLQDIQQRPGQIIALAESFSIEAVDALREAQSLLADYPIDRESLAESAKFGALFGRGQQYLSFSSRH
jgi:hypothetical protein